MPVYSFISGRSTIWHQFAPWQWEGIADLVEHCQMKAVRGAACRACGACRDCALTSEQLFLSLEWILKCVGVQLVSY